MSNVKQLSVFIENKAGRVSEVTEVLGQAGVNIRMIDQGSSEQNIIVGVEDGDLKTAIRAIYDEFATA
mgnify:CR=1 FL=1